jgi:hypothetical protein
MVGKLFPIIHANTLEQGRGLNARKQVIPSHAYKVTHPMDERKARRVGVGRSRKRKCPKNDMQSCDRRVMAVEDSHCISCKKTQLLAGFPKPF